MQPIVNGLEEQFKGDVAFRQFNATESDGRPVFDRYRLRGHPSYVILDRDGKEAWRYTGELTRGTLDEAIRKVLGE